MFGYLTLVKQFELDVLLFARAIRESDFSLYVASLNKLIPWFFLLFTVRVIVAGCQFTFET